MPMNILVLDSLPSTNSYLRQEMAQAPHGTAVAARSQTAGRGQRGNSWEAEPGQNLTFSVMLRPGGIEAAGQWAVSEAVAVAVAETLRPLLDDPRRLTLKWPNDVYVDDMKLGGILIENSLQGSVIARSVAGIGINVNQRVFRSDAPNPVSLWQLTGREHDLGPLLERLVDAIIKAADRAATPQGRAETARRYRAMLWRREGFHPYAQPGGETFEAAIDSIAPTGHITLRHRDGSLSTHAFKEVVAIV